MGCPVVSGSEPSGILPRTGWTGRDWERQTTLLAAICLSDGHMVCISDRRNLMIDQGNAARVVDGDKWRRVDCAPRLLWGWAGGNQVGLALALHVEEAATSWDTLKAVVQQELPTLCGQFPKEPADCLLAGWIADTPGILQIRSDGTFCGRAGDPARLEPQFVGWSSLSAELAWTYATQRLSAPPTGKNFCSLLKLAIDMDGLLSGFEVWDIAPDVEPRQRVTERSPDAVPDEGGWGNQSPSMG